MTKIGQIPPYLRAQALLVEILVHSKERLMHLQIVMDSNGDTRHEFDPTDPSSLTTAEARFQELTGKGFRAVALGKDGAPGQLMRNFDPRAEQTLFMPQLQGG